MGHFKKKQLIKSKSFFVNLFLTFISIVITFLCLEVYLIKTNYPYQKCENINQSEEAYLGEFNETTGWLYKGNIAYYSKNEQYSYVFDSDGIRIPEPNYKIDSSKPRILFIGGSITFGHELNYEDSFPAQINNLLGNKYEVINLGVQGYGTAQSMLRLKETIQRIKPQYVVYTFIPDHINRNTNYDRRLQTICLEFFGTKPIFTVSNGKLKQIKKPQRYVITDRFKLPLFLSLNYQIFEAKRLKKSKEDLVITKEIINEISLLSGNNNAKDYYIYYDTVYDPKKDNYNEYLSSYLFAKNNNTRVLNFFNWASDSNLYGTKYYTNDEDNLHPNASISAEIAKQFVEKFKEDFQK